MITDFVMRGCLANANFRSRVTSMQVVGRVPWLGMESSFFRGTCL